MRLEPIILELEREQNDLLIVAHESVLRVLYGYLMACSATDIPGLEFPRDEIIEVRDQFKTTILQFFNTPWEIDHPIRLQQRSKTHQDPEPASENGPAEPRGH